MELKTWLKDIFEKSEAKLAITCERIGDIIPYIPTNGRYTDKGTDNSGSREGIAWWTNGFWGGTMWQLYNATGKDLYRKSAENIEKRLDVALDSFIGLHHDVGFMYSHTAVANYRLTKNDKSRRRGLHAANILAGRYNPAAKYILAWNVESKGWMIIDTMMNLPLLFWADKELGRPQYSYIAKTHADTVIEKLLRPDGSSNHIAILDHHTGEVLGLPMGQGYESGSSWTRGQAWALYGFALTYHYTNEPRYLDTAKRVAHYFMTSVAKTDYVPLCDFRAPKEPVLYDTTAGAIALCGLLAIAQYVPEHEKCLYEETAIMMLKALVEKHADFNPENDGILLNGTTAYHDEAGHHVPIIYGDYFLIEGLLRLMGKDFFIW